MRTNAALVSRTLAAAGLPRASRYSVWGREVDGFVVRQDGDDVLVHITFTHDRAREFFERVLRVLTDAGYIAVGRGRHPGLGGIYGVTVRKPKEA
jgi:hypothetical protein